MSELVERVAKAIALSLGEHAHWKEHVVDARAAIEAMREPTWEMVAACGSIEIERPGNDETNSTYELWDREIIAVWHAMCDEALK